MPSRRSCRKVSSRLPSSVPTTRSGLSATIASRLGLTIPPTRGLRRAAGGQSQKSLTPTSRSSPPRANALSVSLVPSVTESAFALGGEDRLVGVSDFCDWPPAARRKPRVGGMVNPSLEAIVALKPDLVVGTDEGNREETFLQLRRLGIPVYVVHAHRVAEMYDLIERVGELTGRQAAVAPLVDGIRRRIDAVRAAVKARP